MRFLSLRRISQALIIILVILLLVLLPLTTYFITNSLSLAGFKRISSNAWHHAANNRERKRGTWGDGELSGDETNGAILNYELYSDAAVKEFRRRKAFPTLEPRMVRLTDKNHTFQFSMSPGAVIASDSKLPEKGIHELRSKYNPFPTKNPKKMSEPDAVGKGDCKPLASWQLGYHPTCNQVHEASGGWQEVYKMPKEGEKSEDDNYFDDDREQARVLAQGAFRQVWMIRDSHDGITKRALKILKALGSKEKNYDLRNQDRHRRDAISFEQLKKSPLIVDLYASCSNSAIFDYADGGNIISIFDKSEYHKKLTNQEEHDSKLHLMKIAYNISMSVHDGHNFDAQGRATLAHTDIKADQFIFDNGYYKLSDFNRVRFLAFNSKKNESCGFHVGKNGGEYRSPEEYEYEEENEKVDVFSLGNVLYFLLVRKEVWWDESHSHVYAEVKAGRRAPFPDRIRNSNGIFEKYMIKAIESAWVHRPKERPGALQVANIIMEGIDILTK